jgi:L-2,4-diaminobutyrate decarboxylase
MLSMDFPESELDAQSARLMAAYDPDDFVRQAAAAVALTRDHLASAAAGTRTVWPGASPEAVLDAWPDPASAPPASIEQVLQDFLAGSTAQHHPGFVGQQLSTPPLLAGPVALVSTIVNNSAAIFEGAPVAVAMERRVVQWMLRTTGYEDGAAGILTSGGSLGALTALLAMRQAKVGEDVWRDGLAGSRPAAVLMSSESHYCNRRACAVLGFGSRAVIPVAVDTRFAIADGALHDAYQRALAGGMQPVAVVANAGSTATGSHDDLTAAADFCARHNLWLHVDAAHGGSALLSARYRDALQGIARADSIVWDAHKMMLMPSLCTAVLFRRAADLDATFRQQASYLMAGDDAPWYQPASRNFETTKPALVLPLYATLRTLGEAFLCRHVEYAYDLARAFAQEIERRPEFELLVRPESNIVCFRRRADSGADADRLQLRLREAVNGAGRFFVMRTTIAGVTWLRVVLMNPATRLSHLRQLLDDLAKL